MTAGHTLSFLFSFIFTLTNYPPQSFDSLFLQAMNNATEKDLLFITNMLPGTSLQNLKLILQAAPTNKTIDIYSEPEDLYYQEIAYQPFAHVLKKFPAQSALHLNFLLQHILIKKINKRTYECSGREEIGWMRRELFELKKLNDYFENRQQVDANTQQLSTLSEMRTSI